MILCFYMAKSEAMFTAFSGCRFQAKISSYILIFISFVIGGFIRHFLNMSEMCSSLRYLPYYYWCG